MQIDWWTLGLQTFNVVILIALLSRLLFRPVAAMVAARQQAARDLLAQAEAVRQAAESERQQAASERQAQLAGRDALLASASAEAAQQRDALLADAQQRAEQLRREAQDALARERQQQQARLEQQAGELALSIAARLLQRLPPVENGHFLQGIGQALAALPAAQQAGFSARPVQLRSARPLTAAEQDQCIVALQQVLGSRPQLVFSVEPALLAGLELDDGQTLLRNHLAADLAHLQQELNPDARAQV